MSSIVQVISHPRAKLKKRSDGRNEVVLDYYPFRLLINSDTSLTLFGDFSKDSNNPLCFDLEIKNVTVERNIDEKNIGEVTFSGLPLNELLRLLSRNNFQVFSRLVGNNLHLSNPKVPFCPYEFNDFTDAVRKEFTNSDQFAFLPLNLLSKEEQKHLYLTDPRLWQELDAYCRQNAELDREAEFLRQTVTDISSYLHTSIRTLSEELPDRQAGVVYQAGRRLLLLQNYNKLCERLNKVECKKDEGPARTQLFNVLSRIFPAEWFRK